MDVSEYADCDATALAELIRDRRGDRRRRSTRPRSKRSGGWMPRSTRWATARGTSRSRTRPTGRSPAYRSSSRTSCATPRASRPRLASRLTGDGLVIRLRHVPDAAVQGGGLRDGGPHDRSRVRLLREHDLRPPRQDPQPVESGPQRRRLERRHRRDRRCARRAGRPCERRRRVDPRPGIVQRSRGIEADARAASRWVRTDSRTCSHSSWSSRSRGRCATLPRFSTPSRARCRAIRSCCGRPSGRGAPRSARIPADCASP